ncbi:MAG: hypothetical protein CMJ59_04640 [Planctomycetaceae bacterium]|nr:hypothetical protein [Planctomycetaceae bacterium]
MIPDGWDRRSVARILLRDVPPPAIRNATRVDRPESVVLCGRYPLAAGIQRIISLEQILVRPAPFGTRLNGLTLRAG